MPAAAARIASVATASNIAKDCAPEYNPRCVECCTPIATCSAPAAATNAENFTESASAAIGGGVNAPNVAEAAPADSAANPPSVAAEIPTTGGCIENNKRNLLEQANSIEKIVARSRQSCVHEVLGHASPSLAALARRIERPRQRKSVKPVQVFTHSPVGYPARVTTLTHCPPVKGSP
jgi:hypothetical protein